MICSRVKALEHVEEVRGIRKGRGDREGCTLSMSLSLCELFTVLNSYNTSRGKMTGSKYV